MFLPWWRRQASRQSRPSPRRGRARQPWVSRLRPAIERLEDRTLPSLFGTNLIVNGNAESGPGPAGDPVPGWTVSSGYDTPVVVPYSTFITTGTDPDGGSNIFAGGPLGPMSGGTAVMWQTIDVSSAAASIDANGVTYHLSGWFGGYQSDTGRAELVLDEIDANGVSIGSPTIGPVSEADRGGATELLQRSDSFAVLPGTRSLRVTLYIARGSASGESYNYGFADNLSLVLTGGTQTQQLTQTGTPTIENGQENGVPELATDTTVSAQFIDQDPNAMASDFTNSVNPQAGSSIDWGDRNPDGSPDITPVNLGDIQQVSSDATSTTWQINSRHTYTEGGQYPITIHLLDQQGNKLDIAAGTANVLDAKLRVDDQVVSIQTDASGNPLTEGGASFVSGDLVTFSDTDSGTTPPGPGDYTVKIDWGDGTPQAPDVETVDPRQITRSGGPGTPFDVGVSHPFKAAGNLTIQVTIIDNKDQHPDNHKQSIPASVITATVADAPVTVTAPPLAIPQATVGQPYAAVVAAINDPDTGAKPSDFSGTITWGAGGGDPTPFGPGDVTAGPTPGQFLIHVSNTHTFPTAGTFSVTVQLTEQDRDGGAVNAPIQTVAASVGSVTVVAASSGGGGNSLGSMAVDAWVNDFNVEKTLKQQVDKYVAQYLRDLRAGLQKAAAQRRDLGLLYQLLFEVTQIGDQMAQIVRDKADAFATPENLQRLQDWGLLDAAFQKEIQQALQAALALHHKQKKHH